MSKRKFKRLSAEDRRGEILAAAMTLAAENNYSKVTRQAIADRAGVTPALVTVYFKTMPQLRRVIMRTAIQHENLAVLAQGIASSDAHAMKAPEDLKRKAINYLLDKK